MMLARVARVARGSCRATTATRSLVTSSQKRALNKQQLEGSKTTEAGASKVGASPTPATPTPTSSASAAGGGASTKPANVGGGAGSGGAGSSGGGGGGGGALLGLLALGGMGAGGAYYMGYLPWVEEQVGASGKWEEGKIGAAAKEGYTPANAVKAAPELKEVVEEVIAVESKDGKEVDVVVVETVETVNEAEDGPKDAKESEAAASEEQGEESEEDPLEHPKDGNRVELETMNTFFEKVSEGRAKQTQQELDDAAASAANATAYNESYETSPNTVAALTELVTPSLQNSKTLQAVNAATAALRSDLDQAYFQDLDQLSESELRVRVVQLATEMADRTKWEAVRLKEFLAMKEKEVAEKYLETLQKQRLEFESLLASKLRQQEDTITRQANAALQAKEESIQSLLQATSDAREQETQQVIEGETRRIHQELNLEYEEKMANELAQMKQKYAEELENYAGVMKGLKEKLEVLESRLEVSRDYESGSKKAHRLSAAALALANKLEVGEGAAVELAALKGAAGDEGVIASALVMIPKTAEKGVPTVPQLQAAFDETYSVGRQAAMVPQGRSGLEGQLLGILFSKLSVPPSPDAIPSSDDEGSVADGILSLARNYVHLGDLEKAVELLDQLKGQTAYVMSDWKSRAADRVSTERALKVIKLECALLNKDCVGVDS